MARRTAAAIDKQLAKLKTFEPYAAGAADELRAALAMHEGRVVAVAAKLAGEHVVGGLGDALAEAFEALCVDGAKRDPTCRGKVAIVEAMQALDQWDDRVFVAGLRYAQPEGWAGPLGGRAPDAAAGLRGMCGCAHAYFQRDDALDVLAVLLADDEYVTRVAAVRGIGASGRRDATALLRYKVLTGDPEPDVIAACIDALLDLAREASIPFVLELLEDRGARAEAAVVSLGAARIAEAFEPIRTWAMAAPKAQRHRVAYVAFALLRHEPATELLLDAIANHGAEEAVAAARALATFKDTPALVERVREAAGKQASAATRREIEALLA